MTWYQVKGLLLWPWLWFKRWQFRHASPMDKAILEANRYSRTFKRFAEANLGSALLIHELGLQPGDRVMDVGGFDGEWAQALYDKYEVMLDIYEPMPAALKTLRERFSGTEGVRIHPVALADRDGKETLSLLGPGSSMIRADERPVDKVITIDLQDVASAFAALDCDQIDLFKINIEGAEYQVLDRMLALGLHKRCRVIMIQYHEFVPKAHSLRKSINASLAQSHKQVWNYDFVWERWELN